MGVTAKGPLLGFSLRSSQHWDHLSLYDGRVLPRESQGLFTSAKRQPHQHFPITSCALCSACKASACLPSWHRSPPPVPAMLLPQPGSGMTDLTVRSPPLSPASAGALGCSLFDSVCQKRVLDSSKLCSPDLHLAASDLQHSFISVF